MNDRVREYTCIRKFAPKRICALLRGNGANNTCYKAYAKLQVQHCVIMNRCLL